MASQLLGAERRNFWVLTLAQFLAFCGFFAFFQFPLFIKAVGGGEMAIGVMGGLGALASTAFLPWTADLADRWDRRRLMLGGLGLLLAATLLSLTMTAPDGWMACLVILRGFGFGTYTNAAGAYIADLLPAAERSRWLGVNFGFNQIAVAVGPALGEALIVNVGFPAFFLMAAAFISAAIALLSRVARRPMRPPASSFRTLAVGRTFLAVLFQPRTRHLYLVLLLMSCGLGAVFGFSATYLHGLGLSSGLFFMVYALVNGGLRIGAGGLSDRYGRATVVIPTLAAFAAGLLLYSFTGGVALMVVSAVLIGIGFGLSNPAIMAQLLDRTDLHQRGRVIGGFYFAYQLGALGATPLFGIAADRLGYPPMLWMAGACLVLATAVYAAQEARTEKPEQG
jgi:MFS family permease